MTEKTNQSVELRDYQVDMLERLEKAWKRNRSVMVQMPTERRASCMRSTGSMQGISPPIIIIWG
jgi:hypothetical protein